MVGDTPIVILDGSLTIESAVPWNQFTGNGDQRAHPDTNGQVTSVVATVDGTDHTVTFNNEQCTVDVAYAGTDIKVATGPNGRGLSFSPFSAFERGAAAGVMVHRDQNALISHVTVAKTGAPAFDSAAAGGTRVVIHYQSAGTPLI